MLIAVGAVALIVWIYLLFGHGGFWRARERDDRDMPTIQPKAWPAVTAVVPARNEADVIARSVASLLAQDYPGLMRVVLVDDNSDDGTGDLARAVAERLNVADRLEVLNGAPLAPGWTGKLWAMSQGVARAGESPAYLLLTDADIAHTPDNVRRLVERAEAGGLVMVSLMAKLCVETWAEKLMIPAFVFFFDMLYPFGRVNDPKHRMAAAAGGCMLVRRDALTAAGGIESIRAAIIDDCALGARMKAQGPIWLGLTERAQSLRPYNGLGEIGRMISRSAYAQLGYSPWMLIGTLLGLALVYLAAPLLTVFGSGLARGLGLTTWLAMAISFQPMLRFYRRSPLWGPALPVIAGLYSAFTLDSAIQVWLGRGGMWKGRAQAQAGSPKASGR